MVFAQIERLTKDSNELDIYAQKLEKKGQIQRAQKIRNKRDFILKTIEEATVKNDWYVKIMVYNMPLLVYNKLSNMVGGSTHEYFYTRY